MSLQTLLALAIVAAAVAYIARRLWHTVRRYRTGDEGGASSCGCDPAMRKRHHGQ